VVGFAKKNLNCAGAVTFQFAAFDSKCPPQNTWSLMERSGEVGHAHAQKCPVNALLDCRSRRCCQSNCSGRLSLRRRHCCQI
jgi:hypothetical protein